MCSAYKRVCDVCRLRAGFVGFRLPQRCESTTAAAVKPSDEPEFLRGTPHRKHPGISNLKTLRLPPPLQAAAHFLLHKSELKDISEQARRLSNFLWSRKRAVENEQLREKAMDLEKKWMEKETERGNEEDKVSLEARIRRKVLSELKKTTYNWKPLKYDADLALVFMAARLAGGYAALMRALQEIKKRDPTFAPQSLLDFGSGLGTAIWAANTHWGDSLKEYVCVDSSGPMNSLAEQLLTEGGEGEHPLIKHVYFRQFLPVSPKVQSDLVLAAFSLSELPFQRDRDETVSTLWRRTHSYLVLVENGTKEGHQILMDAKDVLMKREDRVTHDPRRPVIFAPCPHELQCPKLLKEPVLPCNFLQPYYPLPLCGQGSEPMQEKFSYLVVSRLQGQDSGGQQVQWGRLISPVHRRPRHVQCQICNSNGELEQLAITARHHGRDAYRCARSSHWGDRLPIIHHKKDPQTEE